MVGSTAFEIVRNWTEFNAYWQADSFNGFNAIFSQSRIELFNFDGVSQLLPMEI